MEMVDVERTALNQLHNGFVSNGDGVFDIQFARIKCYSFLSMLCDINSISLTPHSSASTQIPRNARHYCSSIESKQFQIRNEIAEIYSNWNCLVIGCKQLNPKGKVYSTDWVDLLFNFDSTIVAIDYNRMLRSLPRGRRTFKSEK